MTWKRPSTVSAIKFYYPNWNFTVYMEKQSYGMNHTSETGIKGFQSQTMCLIEITFLHEKKKNMDFHKDQVCVLCYMLYPSILEEFM